MKVVELRNEKINSNYPIEEMKELNQYSEYFLVHKNSKDILLLRYIEDIHEWYFISLNNYCTHKLVLSIAELCERFHIFCIPEYTGGSSGVSLNIEETRKSRIELFEFLINTYWK